MAWIASKRKLPEFREYELLELLGQGGMGSVYKGRHRGSGALVAIKTLAADLLDDPILRQRFEQEFRAAHSLDHPHVVRALDFGQEGATPYLVMEFVDGQSLGKQISSKGRVPEALAVNIGVQIGRALQAAHQQGIIHRDVKPDNILLGADGQAKLADLGLAKDLDGGLGLTQTRTTLGTLNFMPPEQFLNARDVDAGCDIYGLGATLYMAVTGVVPFRARGFTATLKKKLADDIAPPRQLVPGLSVRFERAILRSIRGERGQRPASCLEFIDDLLGSAATSRAAPQERLAAENGKGTPVPEGKERRATVRYPAQLESSCRPLRGEKQSCWQATVRDVSARGVSLLINRRFEPGALLIVELPATNQSLIRLLLARVVRVQANAPKRWTLGCKLCRELSNEDVQAMLADPPEARQLLSTATPA
jgi:serine/threonine protein kinase